jgi:hypothetical protein
LRRERESEREEGGREGERARAKADLRAEGEGVLVGHRDGGPVRQDLDVHRRLGALRGRGRVFFP